MLLVALQDAGRVVGGSGPGDSPLRRRATNRKVGTAEPRPRGLVGAEVHVSVGNLVPVAVQLARPGTHDTRVYARARNYCGPPQHRYPGRRSHRTRAGHRTTSGSRSASRTQGSVSQGCHSQGAHQTAHPPPRPSCGESKRAAKARMAPKFRGGGGLLRSGWPASASRRPWWRRHATRATAQ